MHSGFIEIEAFLEDGKVDSASEHEFETNIYTQGGHFQFGELASNTMLRL